MADSTTTLRIKRFTTTAQIPTRHDPGSIGYDLYADEDADVQWGFRATIKTGIAVEIPAGCYGRIAPRSGLARDAGVDTLAGVVDPSYTGEIIVILQNHGGGSFTVKRGMKIAQLILEQALTPDIEEVSDLTPTQRGDGGFGSSGMY